MKQSFIHIIAGLLLLSSGIQAQSQQNKSTISVELDPAPFILGGYSVSLKYSASEWNHFTVTGSVYSSKFPDKMMGKSNYENGFRDLKIETSFAVFTDYYLKSNRTGLHFGPSAFFYSKTVGSKFDTERLGFKSIYPNLRIGYVYKPFKKLGLYFDPWFNVGKEFVLNRTNARDGAMYATDKFSYIIALHIGYQFVF